MMRAMIIEEKDKFGIKDVPKPTLQSEDEVIVEIAYTGICGSDIELVAGTHNYLRSGITKYPVLPGHEWSGIVHEVGANVTEFKPGDRVVGDVSLGCGTCDMCKSGKFNVCSSREVIGSYKNREGSFAEYLRTHKRGLYKIPDTMTFQEAATIEPAATSAYTVQRSKVKYGDKVLVIGDGPIGLFAVQCAKSCGASKVVLIGSWEEKLEIARQTGANYAVSYRNPDADKMVEEYMNGELFDVVLETSGNKLSVDRSINFVKARGVIGLVSFYGSKIDVDMNRVITKDAEVQGVLASPNMFAPTLANMGDGQIMANPIITHEFELEDIEKAFATAVDRSECSVKILVKVKKDL